MCDAEVGYTIGLECHRDISLQIAISLVSSALTDLKISEKFINTDAV